MDGRLTGDDAEPATSPWAWALNRDMAGTRELSRVCATFFLDSFSLGACLSVLSAFAEALRFEASVGTPEFAAFGFLVSLAPWAVAPAWRRFSDCFGRRLAFVLSGVCRGLGVALMAVAPEPGSLVASATLWGLSAGGVAISTACVAEVVPLERRAAGFGVLVAAVALGLSAGAHLGNLVGAQEPRLALWICSSLSISGVAYALACLPESRC
jgi:DHA1 family tetracycline resistance protein-like MFS transporter